MGNPLTKLSGLVVNRVAFVHAGDNPHARIALWKAREGGDVTNGNQMLKVALESIEARVDAANASLDRTVERAAALSTPRSEPVSKADLAAGRLRALAEKDLDRRPLDVHGRPRSIEQALATVATTREGKRAVAAVAEEALGKQAFVKAFNLDIPEPPEPSPTASSVKLDALAASIAKEKGVTKEQALVEAIATPEGHQLHRAHREEMAAR